MKLDKTNHRRERDKSHLTSTRRMWQQNRRPSRREREELTQRSVQKKRLGKRPAEDQEEQAQKQSEASSGEKTWGERDERQRTII